MLHNEPMGNTYGEQDAVKHPNLTALEYAAIFQLPRSPFLFR